MTDRTLVVYAIQGASGEWYLAHIVKMDRYVKGEAGMVWQEYRTTAMLMPVGREAVRVKLQGAATGV